MQSERFGQNMHLRWYWWETMYAGLEEGGGAAALPEGGIPYTGFEGSTCKNTKKKSETIFQNKR